MNKTRLMLMAVLISCCSLSTQAQSLSDLFSGLSNAFSKLTGSSTTASSIVGTWTYDCPAMKLKSDNLLAQLGSSIATSKVDDKLASIYDKVGLDNMSITFNSDSTYTSTIKGKTTNGTYTYDAEGKTLTMKTRLGTKIKSNVEVSGSTMTLLFEADKLMDGLKTVSSLASNVSSKASIINSLINNYDGMSMGFKLKKGN